MTTTTTTRYTSILVARPNRQCPCELEVQLRNHCQKMRVYEKLSAGAQFVFPDIPGLAVRILYYNHHHDATNAATPMESDTNPTTNDILSSFTKTFRHAMLFLVVPNMADLDHHAEIRQLLLSATTADDSLRIMVVPDTQHVIAALEYIGEALTPARRQLRQEFSKRCRIHNFCHLPENHPDQQKSQSNDNNTNNDTTNAIMNSAAASTVLQGIVQWGHRSRLEPWEAEILWKCCGSNLKQWATMAAASTSKTLSNVPVSSRAKRIFEQFFSENNNHIIPENDLDSEEIKDLAHGNWLQYASATNTNPHTAAAFNPEISQDQQTWSTETTEYGPPASAASDIMHHNREYDFAQHSTSSTNWDIPVPQTFTNNNPHPSFLTQPQQPYQLENDNNLIPSYPKIYHNHPNMMREEPLPTPQSSQTCSQWMQPPSSVPNWQDHSYQYYRMTESGRQLGSRSVFPAARTTPWGHPPPHRVSYDPTPTTFRGNPTTNIDPSSIPVVYNNNNHNNTHLPQTIPSNAFNPPQQQYRVMM